MTQEEKKLLLIDLSARLPYGVKVDHFGIIRELLGIIPSSENVIVGYDINDYEDSVIEDIKPYLRPMSSMTEEERKEIQEVIDPLLQNSLDNEYDENGNIKEGMFSPNTMWEHIFVDELLKRHFDIRGLIEKGLALEAPEEMYGKI